jgi:hypothetical protein
VGQVNFLFYSYYHVNNLQHVPALYYVWFQTSTATQMRTKHFRDIYHSTLHNIPEECSSQHYTTFWDVKIIYITFNTLRTGDANLRFCITTVKDEWHKSAFLTHAWFPRTSLHNTWSVSPNGRPGRMFKETWPHSELMIYDKYRGKNTRPQCVKISINRPQKQYVPMILYASIRILSIFTEFKNNSIPTYRILHDL